MELYLVVCCFDNLFSIITYVAAEDTLNSRPRFLRHSVQYPVKLKMGSCIMRIEFRLIKKV